jgi:hypothetical protein
MVDLLWEALASLETWLHGVEAWLRLYPTPLNVVTTRLAIAFVLGCIAAAIHYFTSAARYRRDDTSSSLAATLVLLAVLIALVMMVIGDSLARAFGLAGALAIVRFRTVVEDTRDTAFVMFAVIAGMAAGTGYLVGPLICTPVVMLSAWLFRARNPSAARRSGILVLRLAAGKTIDGVMAAAIEQHIGPYQLTGLATARGGSALDATFQIHLPPAANAFAVVNELSRIDGVQGVEIKDD